MMSWKVISSANPLGGKSVKLKVMGKGSNCSDMGFSTSNSIPNILTVCIEKVWERSESLNPIFWFQTVSKWAVAHAGFHTENIGERGGGRTGRISCSGSVMYLGKIGFWNWLWFPKLWSDNDYNFGNQHEHYTLSLSFQQLHSKANSLTILLVRPNNFSVSQALNPQSPCHKSSILTLTLASNNFYSSIEWFVNVTII